MKKETAKKLLEDIGKKYSIPARELDREIELVDLFVKKRESPEFPLRAIRRRLADFYSLWLNYLHSVIFPNPQSIILTKESEVFDEKGKEEIYGIIAVLAKFTRESVLLEVKRDESREADFINESFGKYRSLKKSIEQIVKKNVELWKKESEKNNG